MKGGGGGEGEEGRFLSFLANPIPAYSRHFSRGIWLSLLVLCSETARKRLLRRLQNNSENFSTVLSWKKEQQGIA